VQLARQQVGQVAGVAADDLGAAGRPGGEGQGEVGLGQPRPVGFQFDADGAAVEVDGLDHGSADPAHGVQDQLTRCGVGADGGAGDGGQHLGGVRA
jgi:hypothetical protein